LLCGNWVNKGIEEVLKRLDKLRLMLIKLKEDMNKALSLLIGIYQL